MTEKRPKPTLLSDDGQVLNGTTRVCQHRTVSTYGRKVSYDGTRVFQTGGMLI
jgi:hypothetical protein